MASLFISSAHKKMQAHIFHNPSQRITTRHDVQFERIQQDVYIIRTCSYYGSRWWSCSYCFPTATCRQQQQSSSNIHYTCSENQREGLLLSHWYMRHTIDTFENRTEFCLRTRETSAAASCRHFCRATFCTTAVVHVVAYIGNRCYRAAVSS